MVQSGACECVRPLHPLPSTVLDSLVASRCVHVPRAWARKVIGISEALSETVNNLRTNFITTRSLRPVRSRPANLQARAVFLHHALNRVKHNPSKRAAPAGMHGGKGSCLRIADQDRNAVGGLHSRQNAGCVADNRIAVDRIAASVFCRLRFGELIHQLARRSRAPASNPPGPIRCPGKA